MPARARRPRQIAVLYEAQKTHLTLVMSRFLCFVRLALHTVRRFIPHFRLISLCESLNDALTAQRRDSILVQAHAF